MKFRFAQSHLFALLLLLALASGLRLHGLGDESFNMDEVHQASHYSLPWSQIPSGAARQFQPPLDYYIGKLMANISDSDFGLRIPAAVFGVLSVALLVSLARRLASWWEALAMGLIASLLPFTIYFSQEARPYAIAVFLFLLQLWALGEFVANSKRSALSGVLLLLATILFLHARTLAPLIITANLVVILIVAALFSVVRKQNTSLVWRRPLTAAGILSLGIGAYVPALIFLAREGFTRKLEMSLGSELTQALWSRFDPAVIWMSFAVQTEPLTVPILVLLMLSLPLAYATSRWRFDFIFVVLWALLPLTLFAHILAYYANTAAPFRPPYAWYLLPISMLLAAAAIRDARRATAKLLSHKAVSLIASAALLSMVLVAASATLDFKRQRIKPDWRAVAEYLRTHFDDSHFLLFDSLANYGRWEPTFYGFERYPHGEAGGLGMDRIPDWAPLLVTRTHEPAFVIYEYAPYKLTGRSRYPIFFLPVAEHRDFDFRELGDGRIVTATRFTGFTVLRLSQPSGQLGKDLHTLVTHTIDNLPPSSALVEPHLAAGALARALAMPNYRRHLQAAESLTPDTHRQRVREIIATIEERGPVNEQ